MRRFFSDFVKLGVGVFLALLNELVADPIRGRMRMVSVTVRRCAVEIPANDFKVK